MNPYRMAAPPRRWDSRLSPLVVRLMRPFGRKQRRKDQHLMNIHVQGAEIIREAVAAGQGVMIVSNHPTHADAFSMNEAAALAGTCFHYLATWHVFDAVGKIGQWLLQRHGVFSIDREGTDRVAFKQAVSLLQEDKHPLVIFPEGEVYHCNDRVTPFREGASAIAFTAAKRAERPIVCIPCGMKYRYLEDPTEDLLTVMDQIEQSIHWRPRRQNPLPQRILECAEALMGLKELEFLGEVRSGSLPERTDSLAKEILSRLEQRHEAKPSEGTIPERVKELRRRTLELMQETESPSEEEQRQWNDDLDDLFLAVQLFSYPGDYVAENPTVERLAETIDKLEEDVLGVYSATVRSAREATVTFGTPIPIEAGKRSRDAINDLTRTMEENVQQLIKAGTKPAS